MRFVANFIRFQQCKNFENRLRFDKVTDSLKMGTVLRHRVDSLVPELHRQQYRMGLASANSTSMRANGLLKLTQGN